MRNTSIICIHLEKSSLSSIDQHLDIFAVEKIIFDGSVYVSGYILNKLYMVDIKCYKTAYTNKPQHWHLGLNSLKFKKNSFYTILNVTFHLQLFQNIGYIPCDVQYILEPTLHPIVFTSHSPTPKLPCTPLVTTSLFPIFVSRLKFLRRNNCVLHLKTPIW